MQPEGERGLVEVGLVTACRNTSAWDLLAEVRGGRGVVERLLADRGVEVRRCGTTPDSPRAQSKRSSAAGIR